MASNCAGGSAAGGGGAALGSALSASKTKTKKKHFVAQKVKLFRASDPLLSVLMWGVNHSVSGGTGGRRADLEYSPLQGIGVSSGFFVRAGPAL